MRGLHLELEETEVNKSVILALGAQTAVVETLPVDVARLVLSMLVRQVK